MYEDFLNHDQDWFYQRYSSKLSLRYWTMKVALNLFLQTGGKNIVETGCMRESEDWGGGCSTLVFADFCSHYKRFFWTVDNDKKNLTIAQKETEPFADHVIYTLYDSKAFLWKFEGKIDLLYLDSLDCDPGDELKTIDAQKHQLDEVKTALPKLSKYAIILLDDNNHPWGGKTKLAKEFLLQEGFFNVMEFQQAVFIKAEAFAQVKKQREEKSVKKEITYEPQPIPNIPRGLYYIYPKL